MNQYFPKLHEPFWGDVNVNIDLSNYVTLDEFKNATEVGTSKFALKSDLANLKSEIGQTDVGKLKTFIRSSIKLYC